MSRLLICALVGVSVFAASAVPRAAAQQKVAIMKTWSGSVEDDTLMKPECITSAKGLAAVWQAWKIKEEMPKIDFSKEMVVAVYSSGSKLNMSGAKLDDKGNLVVIGFGTRDLRPGFRYVLGTVSRDGVKTVNGKALPKE